MNTAPLASRVRRARIRAGLSRIQLAEQLGDRFSSATIGAIEDGSARQATPERAAALEAWLDEAEVAS